MKIFTLWRHNTGESAMPWMISAYDEYTAEEHNGEPCFYTAVREPGDRELVIEVPEKSVLKLFATPLIKGEVSE